MQSIGIRAGGNSEDIIAHTGYDGYGRQGKDYLPYALSNNGGAYKTDASSATNTFYDASKYEDDFPSVAVNDINAFSQKEFETSPLNRVLKQAAPGKDWKLGEDNEIELEYDSNGIDEVRRFEVTLTETIANNVLTFVPPLDLDDGGADEFYDTNTL